MPISDSKINISDVWKSLHSMQINIGDVWKNVSELKINIGDSWKTIFTTNGGPQFSGKSGTLADGNTMTISGSNFDAVFDGDLATEYFDNRASDMTTLSDAVAVTSDGEIETDRSTSDWDNANSGGNPDNFHQLEHLGWLAKIAHAAACHSTGFGYRRPTGHSQSGQVASSGDNHGLETVVTENHSELWVSFLYKNNSSGNDSNINHPEQDGAGSYLQKNVWIWNKIPTSMQFFKQNRIGWTGGSICGSNIYWCADGDVDYPKWNTDLGGTGLACSNFYIKDNDLWCHIKFHIKIGASGLFHAWIDGLKVIEESCAYAESNIGRIKFGGNHSGTQDSWLTENNNENWTEDYDDIVVSTTEPKDPACVYLSNSSTWGAGVSDRWNGDATYVRQKVGGAAQADFGYRCWSDIGFKFEVVQGGLNFGSTVYLYVRNWDGDVNANGYALN